MKSRTLIFCSMATCLLVGCMSTGEDRIRGLAYERCSDERGEGLKACMEREIADIGHDWQVYALRYQNTLNLCEENRTLAAAAGVEPDQLSCSRNLADYALRGGPE